MPYHKNVKNRVIVVICIFTVLILTYSFSLALFAQSELSIELDPNSDSGRKGDNITSERMPTLNGTAKIDATLFITVSSGDEIFATEVISNESDSWSYAFTEETLNQGEYIISVFDSVPPTESVTMPLKIDNVDEFVFLPSVLYPFPTVKNGQFDEGLIGWKVDAERNDVKVVSNMEFGSQQFSALLGNPEYENRGGVPIGYWSISQEIEVPRGVQSALVLSYRIYSNDRMAKPEENKFFDTFEVYVDSGPNQVPDSELINRCVNNPGAVKSSGTGLMLCHGHIGEPSFDPPANIVIEDSVMIPLDSTREGEFLNITILVRNRFDNFFNTWAFVDNINIQPR